MNKTEIITEKGKIIVTSSKKSTRQKNTEQAAHFFSQIKPMTADVVVKKMKKPARIGRSCKPHEGESPFMTSERRACPRCGKIYYYDYHPWDNAAVNKIKGK